MDPTGQNFLLIGFSILPLVLNEVIVFIFENIIGIEKNHSKAEESVSLFRYLTVLQFIDSGLILLLVNWKWTYRTGNTGRILNYSDWAYSGKKILKIF